jgi:opacity protein-like surface antigen
VQNSRGLFFLLVAAAAAGSGSFAPVAHADSGFYVGGSIGAFFREDQTATAYAAANPRITGEGRREYDAGPTFSVLAGYKLRYRFRIEAEFAYAHYSFDKDVFGTPFNTTHKLVSGGDINHYMGTINLFYDLPVPGPVVPYVGGGIGGVHGDNSSAIFVDERGRRSTATSSDGEHGVGIIEGGLTVTLSDSFAIVPSYRYVRFFAGDGGFSRSLAAHVGKVGMRYSF